MSKSKGGSPKGALAYVVSVAVAALAVLFLVASLLSITSMAGAGAGEATIPPPPDDNYWTTPTPGFYPVPGSYLPFSVSDGPPGYPEPYPEP